MVKPSCNGLSVKRVRHSFSDLLVLDGVDCSFPKGTFVAILGPSGCGKTTLLRSLAGLIDPDEGEISLGGVAPRVARTQGAVGFAFQSPTLLPWRTTLQNVLLPLEILGASDVPGKLALAQELLSLVGLEGFEDMLPRQLSGGMQQRVGFARSLVTEPSYVFLDEPFGQLDGLTRDRLIETVRELWKKYDPTIVFVTHTIEDAVFLASKIVVMTQRPSHIHTIIDVQFDEPRTAQTRISKQFVNLCSDLRRLTRDRA